MNKKSQIVIFALLGLILLIGFGFIFYLNNNELKQAEIEKSSQIALDTSSITSSIKIYVELCLDSTAKNGVHYLGFRGGYYDVPSNYYEFPYAKIPYYFYLGKDLIPKKDVIEGELSKYIENTISNCINDFEGFNLLGYKFQIGNFYVNTTIAKDNVFVQLDYPIKIIKDSSIIDINNFISVIDLNFDKKYNIAKDIVNENKKNPDSIPIGYIADLAYKNNFTFDIINIEDGIVLYTLIFKENNNASFIYNFMARYNWENLSNISKYIEIKKIGELTAYPGYLFRYKVNVTGKNIKFVDYADLFDIDENSGIIEFTPKLEGRGFHTIMLKAYDDIGHEAIEIFNLNIVSENSAPILNEISNIELKIGEELNKFVNASDKDNDTILYLAQTSLKNFQINPITGLMQFKPEKGQEGEYTIVIIAIDKKGESDKKTFNLKIKNV